MWINEISKLLGIMIVVAQLVEPLTNIIKQYLPMWKNLNKYGKQLIVIVMGILISFAILYGTGNFDVWEILVIGIGSSLDARLLHDLSEYLRSLKKTESEITKITT
jgi:hypothetical protein